MLYFSVQIGVGVKHRSLTVISSSGAPRVSRSSTGREHGVTANRRVVDLLPRPIGRRGRQRELESVGHRRALERRPMAQILAPPAGIERVA